MLDLFALPAEDLELHFSLMLCSLSDVDIFMMEPSVEISMELSIVDGNLGSNSISENKKVLILAALNISALSIANTSEFVLPS